MDILLAEDMLDGDDLDAIGTRFKQLSDIRHHIDEIESGRIMEPESASEIREFELFSSYPNPFNSGTRITFGLPEAGLVNIEIFDLTGREVASTSRYFQAGKHNLSWKADSHPAGTYFLKVKANGQTKSQKLLLIK